MTVADAQGATRQLTVEPATGLENQVVRVHWSGFSPTVDGAHTVTLYQCKGARPSSLGDCYKDFAPPVTEFGTATDQAITGTDGTGSATLEVRPGLELPQLGCSSRSPCSILAYENDGADLPQTGLPPTAAAARLDFAPSPSDCPKVATPDVTTAGEGSAAHALYAWSARVCSGSDPLVLDYTESSSPEGRANFLKGLIDVGLTSTAPTADEIAAGSKRNFVAAPIDLTGVVVAFNASDTVTHEPITEMNLTPRLVAIMIAGGQFGGPGQSVFSDPEFVALNPGHHWPARVEAPLLRSERNADAYLLTNWLNTDRAARAFLDGKDRVAEVDPFWKGISYPTDVFEARDPSTIGSYNPRSGTLTNARRLFNFQPPGDAVVSPANEGLVGVLDAVTARKFGLATAKLRPANAGPNAAAVAADSPGLLAGYRAMRPADAATKIADPSTSAAYPLVKIDYALVPTSATSKAKARDVARFLGFAANDGQAPGVLSPGYVPMPTALRAETTAAQALAAKSWNQPPPDPAPRPTGPPVTPVAPSGDVNGGSDSPIGSTLFGSAASVGTLFGGESSASSFDSSGVNGSDSGTGSTDGPSSGAASADDGPIDSSAPSTRQVSAAAGREVAGKQVIRSIGNFGGAQGQQVLPLLLGAGIFALMVGPGLSLWVRRRSSKRAEVTVEPRPT